MSRNDVTIKVDLKSDGDPPEFVLTPIPPLPKFNSKKNDFAFYNEGEDGFLLRFTLQGNALGYCFPDDEDEALYSALGTECPKTAGQWEQFKANNVTDNNKTLVVINRNDYEAEFAYTLRVKKMVGGKTKWLPLDPGGLNKNGSTRLTEVSQLITVAVGAVAATVLVLLSFGLLKRKWR